MARAFRRRLWLPLAAVLLLVPALGGCTDGLLFRATTTIVLDNPANDATVSIPFTARWHLEPGVIPPAAYGVFIDSTPPRPGEAVDPDALSVDVPLAFVTPSTSLLISEVPRKKTVLDEDKDKHEITVVGLDAQSRRIDESAAFATFRVSR
jgi:hypothetical protein